MPIVSWNLHTKYGLNMTKVKKLQSKMYLTHTQTQTDRLRLIDSLDSSTSGEGMVMCRQCSRCR